jgi:hypothetical protein
MRLTVIRDKLRSDCTLGQLLVDGVFECYTLEDYVRQEDAPKVFGKTAIPYGEYDVVVSFSPHFNRLLPLLLSVPNFEGVRIHPGNTAADTEGCLLVGVGRSNSAVTGSRAAFDALFGKIQGALAAHETVRIAYVKGV